MENMIIILILLLVVGSASFYIYKEKKRGNKCIGCPYSSGGTCPCHCKSEIKEDKKGHVSF